MTLHARAPRRSLDSPCAPSPPQMRASATLVDPIFDTALGAREGRIDTEIQLSGPGRAVPPQVAVSPQLRPLSLIQFGFTMLRPKLVLQSEARVASARPLWLIQFWKLWHLRRGLHFVRRMIVRPHQAPMGIMGIDTHNTHRSRSRRLVRPHQRLLPSASRGLTRPHGWQGLVAPGETLSW